MVCSQHRAKPGSEKRHPCSRSLSSQDISWAQAAVRDLTIVAVCQLFTVHTFSLHHVMWRLSELKYSHTHIHTWSILRNKTWHFEYGGPSIIEICKWMLFSPTGHSSSHLQACCWIMEGNTFPLKIYINQTFMAEEVSRQWHCETNPIIHSVCVQKHTALPIRAEADHPVNILMGLTFHIHEAAKQPSPPLNSAEVIDLILKHHFNIHWTWLLRRHAA